MNLVLDSEAFNTLAGENSLRKQRVRRALKTAARLNRDVVVPTIVLAELYRGAGQNQLVDACLSREKSRVESRDTDRELARLVGGVLSAARAGSEMIVDAHVVACAIEAGGGVVLTADVDDMTLLAGSYRSVIVEAI